jgi:hypothetical protein
MVCGFRTSKIAPWTTNDALYRVLNALARHTVKPNLMQRYVALVSGGRCHCVLVEHRVWQSCAQPVCRHLVTHVYKEGDALRVSVTEIACPNNDTGNSVCPLAHDASSGGELHSNGTLRACLDVTDLETWYVTIKTQTVFVLPAAASHVILMFHDALLQHSTRRHI